MKDLRTIIADHPFLQGMKPEHVDVLARHARPIEFKPGQVIFRQNESAYEFFLILDGNVAVESYVPRADSMPLQTIKGGGVLGWSWLFPPFAWHFQARAVEQTHAIFIDGARLLVACENDPELGYELMRRIAQVVITRLQNTRKRLLENADQLLAPIDESFRQEKRRASTTEDLETLLAEHPFFKGMRPNHLRVLADAAMKRDFAAGESIFREGEVANRFYLIEHGKVILETSRTENTALPVQIIADGDVLGWSWLFPPFYWHFDARAVEPTQTIFLFGTRLRDQCETDHEFGHELMKRVCQVLIGRLQATRKQLLTCRDARASRDLEIRQLTT
jgi:CRP-like cAMP-binding protein